MVQTVERDCHTLQDAEVKKYLGHRKAKNTCVLYNVTLSMERQER